MESLQDIHGALRDVITKPNESDEPVAGPVRTQAQGEDEQQPTPEKPVTGLRYVEPTPYSYEKESSNEPKEWGGKAARYEWKDEYGDVGPRNEELEKQLFFNDFIARPGNHFDDLKEPGEQQPYSVKLEGEVKLKPIRSFEEAGLHPVMMENLKLCSFNWPTAIQSYTIPAIHEGRDVIGIAQTGSGKTAAFLIPILSQLMGKAKKLAAPRPNIAEGWDPKQHAVRAEPLVLIVCPTRELANQIFDDARRLCYRSMLRPCVVYGGAPARDQREELQKGCDILVGTPGRIVDFLRNRTLLSLHRVRYTVIDEADELLQADWDEDFRKLMAGSSGEDSAHRYLMFSASFSKDCRKLAANYLSQNHVRVRISRPGSAVQHVQQVIIWSDEHDKNKALVDLIMSLEPIRTLVFVNHKQTVDYVDDYLFHNGLPSTSMHSDRTQLEREDAMRAFRTADVPIMVTTSVSARGLDIVNVMHVINYDLPRANQGGITEYIHRIGRTARIGNLGLACSFYNERNEDLAPDLVKVLIEGEQHIPSFLQGFQPSDAKLDFEDDSTSSEAEAANEPEADAWDPSEKDESSDKDEGADEAWGQGTVTKSTEDVPAQEEPAQHEPASDRLPIDKDEIAW